MHFSTSDMSCQSNFMDFWKRFSPKHRLRLAIIVAYFEDVYYFKETGLSIPLRNAWSEIVVDYKNINSKFIPWILFGYWMVGWYKFSKYFKEINVYSLQINSFWIEHLLFQNIGTFHMTHWPTFIEANNLKWWRQKIMPWKICHCFHPKLILYWS